MYAQGALSAIATLYFSPVKVYPSLGRVANTVLMRTCYTTIVCESVWVYWNGKYLGIASQDLPVLANTIPADRIHAREARASA